MSSPFSFLKGLVQPVFIQVQCKQLCNCSKEKFRKRKNRYFKRSCKHCALQNQVSNDTQTKTCKEALDECIHTYTIDIYA